MAALGADVVQNVWMKPEAADDRVSAIAERIS